MPAADNADKPVDVVPSICFLCHNTKPAKHTRPVFPATQMLQQIKLDSRL